MKDRILEKLKIVEEFHDVEIMYAVESGSRAWGFASENSDYDVRFIYKHKPEWYLNVSKNRDSIEDLNELLDFAGWDIRKTLQLFHKMNPPLMEWLDSPIIYLEKTSFAQELRTLLKDSFSPKPIMFHYMHMAMGNYNQYLKGKSEVKLKKYLYVLRPIICCMWIDKYNSMPPTAFSEVVRGLNIIPSVQKEIDSLIVRKMTGLELSLEKSNIILNKFIEEKLNWVENIVGSCSVTKLDWKILNQISAKYILDKS